MPISVTFLAAGVLDAGTTPYQFAAADVDCGERHLAIVANTSAIKHERARAIASRGEIIQLNCDR
jgi:hypothetical protein